MGNQQSQSALASKLQARKEKIFPEKNKDKQQKQTGSETKTGTGIAPTSGDSQSRVTYSDGESSSTILAKNLLFRYKVLLTCSSRSSFGYSATAPETEPRKQSRTIERFAGESKHVFQTNSDSTLSSETLFHTFDIAFHLYIPSYLPSRAQLPFHLQ